MLIGIQYKIKHKSKKLTSNINNVFILKINQVVGISCIDLEK